MNDKIADAVIDAIGTVTEPLHQRIKALESEIRDLRASKAVALTADLEHRLHQLEAAIGIDRR